MKKLSHLLLFALLVYCPALVRAQCTTWKNVGTAGFTPAAVADKDMIVDAAGTPYVIFKDSAVGDRASVMKYDGSAWTYVGGAPVSTDAAALTQIARSSDGTIYVFFLDGSTPTVKKYNGSAWVNVGSPGMGGLLEIDPLGRPVLGRAGGAVRYNGTTWEDLGTFPTDYYPYIREAMAIDNAGRIFISYTQLGVDPGSGLSVPVPYVAVYNGTSWSTPVTFPEYNTDHTSLANAGGVINLIFDRTGTLYRYQYNGSSWDLASADWMSGASGPFASATADGSGTLYYACRHFPNPFGANVLKYSGGWSAVGTTSFSKGAATYPVMGFDNTNTPYVCFLDYANGGRLTVMKYTTGAPAVSGQLGICTGYITTLGNEMNNGAWSSSNTSVATIGSTGIITGLSPGTTVVSYVAGSCSTSATVTVNAASGDISGASEFCEGSATAMSVVTGGGAWTSSNTAVAAVNSSGLVTGVGAGSATITYVISGCTYTKQVTVQALVVQPGIQEKPFSATSVIERFAGMGTAGFSGDAGNAVDAKLKGPSALLRGPDGSIYIADNGNHRIRKVDTLGIISTIAGTGTASFSGDGGPATVAAINSPGQMVMDAAGNLYFADTYNSRIRKINTSGIISTVAGTTSGYSGDGGPATAAKINTPVGLAIDAAGNLYVADLANARIRKIDAAGDITTMAGTGTAGFSGDGGAATLAKINNPGVLWAHTDGSLYFVDRSNSRVRKISATGVISTLVSGYSGLGGILVDELGYFYVSSDPYNTVWRYSPSGSRVIVAGSGVPSTAGFSGDGGPAVNALMRAPGGLAFDRSGNLLVADADVANNASVVRRINTSNRFMGGERDICIGDAVTMEASLTGGSWISSAPAVASVGTSGVVTGISEGTAEISYQVAGICNTVTAVLTVNVMGTPSAGVLSGASIVCTGSSIALSSTEAGGAWSCADSSVALASADGTVSGLTAGVSVISYSVTGMCGSAAATAAITVNVAPDAGAITGTHSACTGSDIVLSNAIPGGVWISSDPSVATVSGGAVSGHTVGTAIISYVVLAACGSSYVTHTVTVNAPTVAGTLSGAASVCQGDAVTFTPTVAGGVWSSSNDAIASAGTSGTLTGVSGGAATISYAVTGSCGTAYATRTLTVNATATAGTISGTGAICTGGTAMLSSVAGGGTWSSSNTAVANISAGGVVTGLVTGTATISYAVTNSCGSDVATKTVTVTTTADAGAITGTLKVCPGSSTTLTNTNSGGTWTSYSPSIATAGAGDGIISGVAAGTSYITYTLPSGCYSRVIVTVNAQPTAIGGTASVCEGATTPLVCATPAGTWSVAAAGVASVTATGVVTGIAAGMATVSYTLTTGCARAQVVTVNARPQVITGAASMCINASTTLASATTGGTWSSANTGRATVGAATGYVTGITAGTAIVSYQKDGCFRTTIVTVNTAPNAIGGTATVCEGATITLTNTTAGGSWSNNGAFATIGSATGVVSGFTAGISTVSYMVGATGCFTTRDVTVNVTPSAITGTNPICAGTASSFTSTPAGGSWVSSAPATAGITSAGVVTGVAAGTSNMSYTLSTGCRRTVVVTVSAQPAAISGTLSMCLGSSTSLTAGTAGQTWSSSNGSIATVGSTSAVAATVTGLGTGTAAISYTNAAGCARVVIVTVNAAAAAINGPASICLSGTAAFSNTAGGGTWSSSTASVATIVTSSGAATGVSAGTSTITYRTSPTCFTIRVVSVTAAPAAAITGPSVVCLGNPVVLSHADAGGTWSSSNTGRATINSMNGTVTGLSAGTVTMTYYTAPGCFRSYLMTVGVPPNGIGGTLTLCEGASAMLSSATSGGTWSCTAPGIATINAATGLLSTSGPGTAQVSYILTANGCFTTKAVTVNALPSAIGGAASVCAGSTTTLSSVPATGTWVTGAGIIATAGASTGVITGVAAGTANITYTLPTGCRRVQNVTVNALPAAITGTAVVNELSTTTLASATTGGTWASNNGAIATVGAGTGVVTGVLTGNTTITYQLTATGCYRTRSLTVNPFGTRPAAEAATETAQIIRIYPSPTSGVVTIEAPVKGVFRLFTLDGRQVNEFEVHDATTTVNLPYSLAAGVYMCRFEGEDGSVLAARLVYAP